MKKSPKSLLSILLVSLVGNAWAADPAASSAAFGPNPVTEIALLKAQLAEQQKQIEQLRATLEAQQKTLERLARADPPEPAPDRRPSLGEVASLAPMVPVPVASTSLSAAPLAPLGLPSTSASLQAKPAASPVAGPTTSELSERLNGYLRNVVRLSGDMRFRYDLQLRSGNSVAGPLQNSRERYRLRVNFDKDLFLHEGDQTARVKLHAQVATEPFNNPITMDTDFTGIDTRAPISVSEAWIDVLPTKSFTFRLGRMSVPFADNRQFVWDDDIRFNGFQETYRYSGHNGFFAELRAAQFLLTNPNVPIVPAGSPFLMAGYSQGQRVHDSSFFDQGIVVGTNLGKRWTMNGVVNYNLITERHQTQLASTAAGFPVLTSPAVGATLTGPLPQIGNATTAPGGAMYYANGFNVIHGALNLNYAGMPLYGHNFPFQLFLQFTHNYKGRIDNNGYTLGASFGQVAKLGDIQFQYQYLYKEANAFISQFTDDDVGTGSGTNVKVHHIRLNFGLTRFLVWENRVFFQKGISQSNPAINYFVPLQQGYNLGTRLQSQFNFIF
jgi:hypothetical protein